MIKTLVNYTFSFLVNEEMTISTVTTCEGYDRAVKQIKDNFPNAIDIECIEYEDVEN